MDLHYKRATTVGALVIVATAVFLAGAVWLSGRSLAAGNLRTIRFQNVGNLNRGTPVRVSGVEVGKVEEIEFRGVGDIAVKFSLANKRVTLKADARAKIVAVGLVGDVALDLVPGDSTAALPPDVEIDGTLDEGFGSIGASLADQASATLQELQKLLSAQLTNDLHATLTSTQRLMNTLADTARGPMAEISKTLMTMRALGARMDSTLASPGFRGTVTNLDSATASLTAMSRQLTVTGASLDTLLGNINRGTGTLGKFATDSTLYREMVNVSRSLRALLDTLNANPGKLNIKFELF